MDRKDKEQVYQAWRHEVAEMEAIQEQIKELRRKMFTKSDECGRLANWYYLATGKTETVKQRRAKEES